MAQGALWEEIGSELRTDGPKLHVSSWSGLEYHIEIQQIAAVEPTIRDDICALWLKVHPDRPAIRPQAVIVQARWAELRRLLQAYRHIDWRE